MAAVTYTAKGTAQSYNLAGVASLSVAGVVLTTGRAIIVCLAFDDIGETDSLAWGATPLTLVRAASANGARLEVWAAYNVTGGTDTVAWSSLILPNAVAMTVCEVGNVLAAPADGNNGATGTSATPNSGTVTGALPYEMLIGAVATEGPDTDTAGTWGASWTAGQRLGTTAGLTGDLNMTISEAFRPTTTIGPRDASKSGITSRDWAAAIIALKATEQTLSPATVAGVGAAVLASVIVGVSTVAGIGGVPPINTTIFAASTVSGAGKANAPASAGVVDASYGPTVPTTQNFLSVRATAPANLGDANAATETLYRNSTPPTSGTAEVKATAMADVPPEQQFSAISHVVFRAIAHINDIGPYARMTGPASNWPGGAPNTRIAWKVGAAEAEAALVNDDPAIGTGIVGDPLGGPPIPAVGFVLRRFPDAMESGDALALDFNCRTAPILVQPNGSPWTWAAINALVDVAIRYSWSGASPAAADLDGQEVLLDIYGPQGSNNPDILMTHRVSRTIVMESKMQVTPLGG